MLSTYSRGWGMALNPFNPIHVMRMMLLIHHSFVHQTNHLPPSFAWLSTIPSSSTRLNTTHHPLGSIQPPSPHPPLEWAPKQPLSTHAPLDWVVPSPPIPPPDQALATPTLQAIDIVESMVASGLIWLIDIVDVNFYILT